MTVRCAGPACSRVRLWYQKIPLQWARTRSKCCPPSRHRASLSPDTADHRARSLIHTGTFKVSQGQHHDTAKDLPGAGTTIGYSSLAPVTLRHCRVGSASKTALFAQKPGVAGSTDPWARVRLQISVCRQAKQRNAQARKAEPLNLPCMMADGKSLPDASAILLIKRALLSHSPKSIFLSFARCFMAI